MRTNRWMLTVGAALSASLAAAQDSVTSGVPCSVAAKLDYSTYSTLLTARAGGWGVGWSEAAEDEASATWANCRAGALDARLGNAPNLRARVQKMRTLLRTLRAHDGTLGAYHEGGGSLYGHAVPRSYVDVEGLLESVVFLASGQLGGELVPNGAAILAKYDLVLAARLKTWRAYRPDPDLAEFAAKPSDVREEADGYEKTTRALVALLGTRPDNATLLVRDFANDMMFFDERGRMYGAEDDVASAAAKPSASRAVLPCEVAANVDLDAFTTLTRLRSPNWTSADLDVSTNAWLKCRAGALTASLRDQPNLSARMNRLRVLLNDFRVNETRLARLAKERGPAYATQTWQRVRVEALVSGTASLARTTFGGQGFAAANARMATLRGDFQKRLAGLRGMKFTDDMNKRGVTAARWNAAVDAWAKSYAAVVALVGTRADNATLVIHQYLDDSLDADSIEWY